MRHSILGFFAGFSVLTQSHAVLAQDDTSKTSYEPAYFTQFQPNTALEMVQRVPGFTIQGGGGGARGLGQASLNILINGRRPSSKSSDARDILRRIPADSIKRIDVVDGASLDIPGLSGQVADIITSQEEGSLSGSWRYDARFADGTDPQLLEGEVSVTGTRGNLEFVAGIGAGQFTFDEIGREEFFGADLNVFEERQEDIFFTTERPSANLNLTYTPDNGHVANLNASLRLRNRRTGSRETFQAIESPGITGASLSDGGEDEVEYEIGGDYSMPLGKGTLKLIGLHRLEDSDSHSDFVFLPENDDEFRSTFDRFDEEAEFIARGEYSWSSKPTQDWQFSWEGAFNYLDSDTEFTDISTPLVLDNVRVEEKRTEANLTHSWALSDAFNLQTSLGAEYSELEVTTDASPTRTFFRPKGFISASYDINKNYTLRTRIERDVGQLNFGTFVSSIDVSEDTQSTGNNDIVPTQFWNGEIEVEKKTGMVTGAVKVFARFLEDPIDRIIFQNDPNDPNDDTEGPGNLDNAIRYGIEGNMTWVFDTLGAKGLRLELEGGLEDSSIDDPITGVSRNISDTVVWTYDVEISHDIPNSNWAWGLELSQFKQSEFFGIDETFEATFVNPRNIARLTHKDVFGMRMDIFFQNFIQRRVERERFTYDGDRAGAFTGGEFFSRERGKRMGLRLSDTF